MGTSQTQVTDLLYAAQEPFTRKDFEGRRIEIVGQYLTPKKTAAGRAKLEPNSFMLLRLVMVCCAADMMPAAVKIGDERRKPTDLHDTNWIKVVGRVHYRPRPKGPSADGIDYGDIPEPVIVADSITKAPAPKEKYIY